jgi:hypothetical protein
MRELALHILDLGQNSLEAGAQKVRLTIQEDIGEDWLEITVSDNGRGMNETERKLALDPFFTTRSTRHVGLGLPLVEMYTRRCGGHLAIESDPGLGTTVKAAYRYSHWDRPPLGNMVETLKTIIIANPNLDFHYTHTVNGASFSISTQEITEILGDVPLSHPEVIRWLHDYLTENLAILHGGV